jgi:hypothetical protein
LWYKINITIGILGFSLYTSLFYVIYSFNALGERERWKDLVISSSNIIYLFCLTSPLKYSRKGGQTESLWLPKLLFNQLKLPSWCTHILEGVVILRVTIHKLHRKKMNGFMFKIDFEKTYDKLNWSFLQQALPTNRFDPKWCEWIQQYIKKGS